MRSLTLQDIKNKGSKVISDVEISYSIVNLKVKSVVVPIEKHYIFSSPPQ